MVRIEEGFGVGFWLGGGGGGGVGQVLVVDFLEVGAVEQDAVAVVENTQERVSIESMAL